MFVRVITFFSERGISNCKVDRGEGEKENIMHKHLRFFFFIIIRDDL